MALTALQRDVCRLLADNRIVSGESYVAGDAALNELLEEARDVIERLPPDESGRCVLGPADALYRGGPAALRDDLAAGRVTFHPGRIRGAFPSIRARRE